MAGEFELIQLGEVASVRSGFAFKSSDWTDSGVPVVKISNVKDGRLEMDGCSFVSQGTSDNAPDARLRVGDILIAMTGYIGDVALVRDHNLPVLLNQRVGRFDVRDQKRLDGRFLFYVLRNPAVRQEIEGLGYGSAQPNVSPTLIHGVKVPLPPLHEQRAIAHILGTLDDRIEANRRMAATLEEMARALFRAWFVTFEPVRAKAEGRWRPGQTLPGLPASLFDAFPARLDDDGKPEGWKREQLGAHVLNFDAKRVPVSGGERAKRKGPFPYHGATGVMDCIDDYLFDGVYLLVGEDGSVAKENGLAFTQYVWGKIWVNNHAHVLQGKGSVCTEHLLLYFQHEVVTPYITGAVQQKLSQGRMNAMPFMYPGPNLCKAFSNLMVPLFARYRANVDESRILAATCDLLLPKLVSGAIRVKDAEAFLKARGL